MITTNSNSTSMNAAQASQERGAHLVAGGIALFFGLFLLYGVGFAQPAELHNAAHDSRHFYAFPCH